MLKKYESLKKNREFQAVYRQGRSKANRSLVMIVLESSRPGSRVGISVSKKVGNSVVRHRVTRVIREVIRLNQDKIMSGYDIVIVARPSTKGMNYHSMENDVFHLLKLHHLLKVKDSK
ncbi:MAG: ribonuclease P protein component [Eubacterium sp.]|nr:ribonuclease P protein component [Eubacterium sp.]